MRLHGKVAIVTGAASGTGRAIAKLFAEEGAKVVVTDINVEAAKKVAGRIQANGGEATAVYSNVTQEEDIRNLIELVVKSYGTLDILVNNAGVMDNFTPVGEVTDELWEKVFGVNITGPMRLIRRVMPIFLEKSQGVIINVASVGGLQGSRAGAAYTASKHALIGLTKNIGYQYAMEGIRCNAIAPGGVNTGIGATINNPSKFGMERAMSGAVLNPRAGEPEEIASVALFLASEEASFVNGTVLVADSGWCAY